MKKKLLLYEFRICKVAAFCVGGGNQPPAYCHNREMFPPLSALFKFFQHIFIKKGCNYYGNICCKIRR